MKKGTGGGKIKTASSLRAAENLISKGFSSGFIGFNAVGGNNTNVTVEESELIVENLGEEYTHELKILLKKIEKKDKLTKEKGIKELKEIVMKNDISENKLIYEAYAVMFSKLCAHASPTIRSLAIDLLKILISSLKKDASKKLKLVMPYVIFSTSDASSQVKRQGDSLIEVCFPGKRNQIFVTFKEQLDDLCMEIISKTHKLMKPQKFVEDETDKQRESRLIAQSLGTLLKLIKYLNDKEYSKKLSEKFSNPVIINHLTSLTVIVKTTYLELILELSKDNEELFIETKLSSIILSNLDNDDILFCKAAFNCFLKFAQNDKYFEKVDINKAIIPKIIKIVRRCYIKWSFISDNLLPVFDIICKRNKEKKQSFTESILDSLLEREIEKKTSDSFVQSISEIYKYSLFTSGDLGIWIFKKGKDKQIMEDEKFDMLIDYMIKGLVDKFPEFEDFAIKFYEATNCQKFKKDLLNCPQISTELYLSFTEKKSDGCQNISLEPLFKRFADTEDQTIKVQILQKSLNESNEEELCEYFKKHLNLKDPFTCLAVIQAIDDTNINKLNIETVRECILVIYNAVGNKKISGLVFESLKHLYKYFDNNLYEKTFLSLIKVASPDVYLALLDLLANGNYIPDIEENLICFLFKLLLKIKKTISPECSERLKKIFNMCNDETYNIEEMNNIYENFLKNKKISRILEFSENAIIVSDCNFLPFLIWDSKFDFYSKFLSKNFYSLLSEHIEEIDCEENITNLDTEETFLLLLKKCLIFKKIIENGNGYDEDRGKKSVLIVLAFNRILQLIKQSSYIKDLTLDYTFNIEKYDVNELSLVLPEEYRNYSCYKNLLIKNEVSESMKPSSKELRGLIENNELRDKIYLDDDWEDWMFLYTEDKKKLKSLNYILNIFLKDADIFNTISLENADDFRVCGLVTLFSYGVENIDNIISNDNSISLQLFRNSIKIGCDIITKREKAAKTIRGYHTIAENYELKEWIFVIQSVFPNILKIFLHLNSMSPSFYISNINLINSISNCIITIIDQIKCDEIVQEPNMTIEDSTKKYIYIFTELMQNKLSAHVQIVAASLFHTVLPLYFYYENKKLVDETKKESENITVDKCVAILPPVITALLKKVDLEQIKADSENNGLPTTYIPFELLLWNSLIYFFKTLEAEEKLLYMEALDSELVSIGLGIAMFYLPDVPFSRENSSKKHFKEIPKFRNCHEDQYLTLSNYACYVFYQTLKTIPVFIRQWINLLPNSTKGSIKDYIVKYFSPSIIEEELINSSTWKEKSGSRLSIKVCKVIKTIEAFYEIEPGSGMNLRVILQDDYPLSLPIVETDKSVVAKKINNKWLMQVSTYISHQNGLIISGLQQWKRNFDKHLEGIENCSICIMIVNSVNNQLPRVKCKQCKHKFHAQCLYKWFDTSNNSSCPLCRTEFI
ncbi:E3 ubiquitin-protein ligase listerin [Strongyloides ratti]|uniref:E3 ubiquitin-protein ligase listerin n=1 Tax=Strongyloides ratti TaxID=34506 RepID=A0A090MYB3_STRRB|nr:E3 ubiquitin-protein ligase listerin [Strongyloides ratti]CEF66884.1 E3 ubiquitin-protein ligase listerin [Strongyloides ratti]